MACTNRLIVNLYAEGKYRASTWKPCAVHIGPLTTRFRDHDLEKSWLLQFATPNRERLVDRKTVLWLGALLPI